MIAYESLTSEIKFKLMCQVFSIEQYYPKFLYFQTSDNNILLDGTMIDLCGVVVVFRTVEGLEKSPVRKNAFMNLLCQP